MSGVSKITPAVVEQLLALCRKGMTWEGACEVVDGPDARTVRRWRERGQEELHRIEEGYKPRAGEVLFAELAAGVSRARRQCEDDALDRIQRIAEGGDTKKRMTTTVKTGLEDGREEITTTVVEEVFRPEWTASAWILERVIGGHYRRRERLELSFDPQQIAGQLIDAVSATLSDPELRLSDGQRLRFRQRFAARLREIVPAEESL